MGMPQAYSSNIGPVVTAPRIPRRLGRGKERRVDSGAARQWNSKPTAAPPGWAKSGPSFNKPSLEILRPKSISSPLMQAGSTRLHSLLLHNKEDAEDALQDGMCKAFTSLRSFQGRSSFSTWLTRIVVNSALMARRRKSAHPEASLDEILDSQPERLPQGAVDAQPDPENTCAAIEFNVLVEEHVRQLSPALQAAFRLRAMNGLSSTESSQALGIWENAFRSRFLRARRKLVCLPTVPWDKRDLPGRRGRLLRNGGSEREHQGVGHERTEIVTKKTRRR